MEITILIKKKDSKVTGVSANGDRSVVERVMNNVVELAKEMGWEVV